MWKMLLYSNNESAVMAWSNQTFHVTDVISFPKSLGDSGIVLEALTGYEGPFLEDKSNEEVTNVACLIIRNQGNQAVSYARIQLSSKEQTYFFEAWDIPDGAAVAVLDKNKARYQMVSLEEASVSLIYADMATHVTDINITERGMGEVLITNLGASVLDNLVIYHKGYDASCALYLGGITHLTKCHEIEPGETIIITPEFYANGYSRILWIKTERGLSDP